MKTRMKMKMTREIIMARMKTSTTLTLAVEEEEETTTRGCRITVARLHITKNQNCRPHLVLVVVVEEEDFILDITLCNSNSISSSISSICHLISN
jgi:hypothetical protein